MSPRTANVVSAIVGAAIVGGGIFLIAKASEDRPALAASSSATERAKAGPYIASTKQLSDTETLSTVVIPSPIGPVLDRQCFIYRNSAYQQARFACPADLPLDPGEPD